LGLGRIGEVQEGVVGGLEGDAGLRQLPRQPAVAVEVDLQAKRRPGRHPHVAQAELRVDEVEVVVQALAADRLEEGLAARLVMPGTIGGAGLHGGEDVHQPRVIAALGEDLLDPILLAERLELTDELDLKPGLGGQALGVGADLLAQRLGPVRIVKQADAAPTEVARHRPGVADVRQGARDHDRSKHDSTQPISSWCCSTKGFIVRLRCWKGYLNDSRSVLFGSGFAGLGFG
jgi:hypothetical protein